MNRRNLIAQWSFDTRPILGRFHLWLEDVEIEWLRGKRPNSDFNNNISFVESGMERLFIMTAAVTALGTKLFGRYGEGAGLDKKGLNRVKKDADAISAYAMSEGLWYLSRSIPENHAIMVCLGEGLMPKVGESQEMGSNPLLGFGRIYARPQVAKFLDALVQALINSKDYTWDDFHHDLTHAGITVWGAAIDTLENTSRFANGADTGPMTVLHVFDQPLSISRPYEGYTGNLVLPREIVQNAKEHSLLVDFFTPRNKVLEAIKITYPKIKNENVHVWTLGGKSREGRIGKIWKDWQDLGIHLIEEGWELPNGEKVFTESGTYAPTFSVGSWTDSNDEEHLFIVDGYAASAEAIQAASLYPILDLDASMAIFSSKYELSYEREALIMRLDPDSPEFAKELSEIFEKDLDEEKIEYYRENILLAQDAGIPLDNRVVFADDFLPEKKWQIMAISGYMLPDPYTKAPGVIDCSENTYKVTVRLSTGDGDKRVTLTLRLLEDFEESRLVFNPLLNRFMRGENYKDRPVKISDSGRIRNELQTLCSEALEHFGPTQMRVHFDRIPTSVIPEDQQKILHEILTWYLEHHPIWFNWLELA